MKRKKWKQRTPLGVAGFTLIDLMVAMGLGGVAITTTIAIITQAGRVRREENLHTSILAIRTKIYNVLSRFDDFQAIMHSSTNASAPSNMGCLTTNSCALNYTGGNFALLYTQQGTAKPNGIIFYNPRNASEGFNQDGERCPTPSGTAPNAACPIRVDLAWTSKCAGCGMIQIDVTFEVYRPTGPTAQRVRGTAYDFTLLKNVYPSPAGPSW